MTTILIRNGKIIDGTSANDYEGHVLIENDTIKDVVIKGSQLPSVDEVIEAGGCVISPGFIDVHSHCDWILPLDDHDELMKCFLEQGITTIIAGNCGFSPAPVINRSRVKISELKVALERPLDFSWGTMGEFLDRLEEVKPVVNVAELVGHGHIRIAHAKNYRETIRREELNRCLDSVKQSFDEGAVGLSFGLGYPPGMYSSLEEIEAFCKVAAAANRLVTVHLKALTWLSPAYPATTLPPHNLRALKEMLDIARRTNVKLQISHFLFGDKRSWATAEKAFEMVHQARRVGGDIRFDIFPYLYVNTTINILFPYWFLARTPDAYDNPVAKFMLNAHLNAGFALLGFHHKNIQIMDAAIDGLENLNGLTIPEIAEKWETTPFDVLLKLSKLSQGGTLMLFHFSPGDPNGTKVLEDVLSDDLCLFETDAVVKSKAYPNPAAMGTFPLILGPMVRDRKLFSLENAVHRSTYASAERFGIKDRGMLAKGKTADIVIFDPDTISDTPPAGSMPASKPNGIKYVLINGMKVVNEGDYVPGARYGRVLRA